MMDEIKRFVVRVSVFGGVIEMMRFDCCWPDTTDDSAKLERIASGDRKPGDTEVRFAGIYNPTAARWRSFGCEVLTETKAESE